jgi:hypothetical protein
LCVERELDEGGRGSARLRRIERTKGREGRTGLRGQRADLLDGRVEGQRDDGRAVQMRRDGSGRARDRIAAEGVMDGVYRGLDTEDRDQDDERGADEPA